MSFISSIIPGPNLSIIIETTNDLGIKSRRAIYPGSDISSEDGAVGILAQCLWTPEALANYMPSAPEVPQSVSPYQARIALLNAGLLDQVTTLMADPNTPQAAKIAWEYATTWERNSYFIKTLGPLIGKSESEIDDLFRAAELI